MPGKVNPTQCEALTMVCAQVYGNDAAVAFGGSQGNFELNVFKPLIAHNVLHSIRILGDSVECFTKHLLVGLKPNRKEIARHLERSLMLVTALSPTIGYDKSAQVAHKAFEEGKDLKEIVVEVEGLMSAEEFDRLVNPSEMTHPHE